MKLKVNESMSSQIIAATTNENLLSAYNRMKQSRLRHLPVFDDEGNLSGIISDRDFQRAMWPVNITDPGGDPDSSIFRRGAVVSDYMSWPVKSLTHESDLSSAVELMIENKISAIVVTQHGDTVGIVTNEDLLRILAVLLKKPESLKERALAAVFKSPLGKVVDALAQAGL
jgi:predicted transcriptional regulator